MAYAIKQKIRAKPKSYPLSLKKYSKVNSEADVEEKRKHPKGYKKLKRLSKSLDKDEELGHISKSGKVTVSKKVPRRLRKEVEEHDRTEKRLLGHAKRKK